MFSCSACPYKSSISRYVKTHQNVNHKTETCEILHDGVKMKRKDEADNVENAAHKFYCSTCPYQSSTRKNVGTHQRRNHKTEDCGILYEGVMLKKPRKVRKKTAINNGKYKCSICGFRYQQKSVVRKHQQKHHKDKDCTIIGIGCQHCEKDLPHSQCKFILSEGRKGGNALLISCEKCQSKILKASLRKHDEITHLGYINFSCSGCSYKSYFKNHVILHQKRAH